MINNKDNNRKLGIKKIMIIVVLIIIRNHTTAMTYIFATSLSAGNAAELAADRTHAKYFSWLKIACTIL